MGKLIYRDLDRVIVEITKIEYDDKGFDIVWDEIRIVYKEEYELVEHYYSNDEKIINFVLEKKQKKEKIFD
jgi:hypothetical protein